MAVTEAASGSLTATLSTEVQLGSTITVPGIYVLRVDIANLIAGDIIELRIYTKCRNATDTERLKDGPVSYGPIIPEEKLPDSIPVLSTGDYKATLKQLTGAAGRVFPWVVLSTGA